MTKVPRIDSIFYHGIPTNRYAVKLSDIASYGKTPIEAMLAFAAEESAKPYSVFNFSDGEYVVFEPIS